MPNKKNIRYAVLSHHWRRGIQMNEVPQEENPDLFWKRQSNIYCSVMFQSLDGGKNWTAYKKKGIGAIDKILSAQESYLPKPQIEPAKLMVAADKRKRYQTRDRSNLLHLTAEQNSQKCIILMVGISQHGKSTTLNSLFGKECFPSSVTGESKTREIAVNTHPEVDNLVFLDTPGINETDSNISNEKIIGKILECTGKVKEPDAIFVCRRFTHTQTKGYFSLKKMTDSLRTEWPRSPLFLIYTRCCDKPDLGILNDPNVLEDFRKYQAPPYSYRKTAAQFAAFRDLRIRQGTEDGFLKTFFVENDEDEEGKLPDNSNCWVPLVKTLTELSPLIKNCIIDPTKHI